MNIVYIHTHDTGRFIEPYGYPVPTPHLMRLAEEGVTFRQAYCAAPTCSPSRAAMLTGQSAHVTGMTGLVHRGFSMKHPERHLASYLARMGYDTVLSGIQHEAKDAADLGYRRVVTQDGERGGEWDRLNARAAAQYIREQRSADRPFFLSYGMFSTHREFPEQSPDVNPNYVLPPVPIYDTKETREDMARYISSAKVADECVGIVLDSIRDAGLEEQTLVIFTTDHGIAFPRMKCNLYDTGIGVSLIMRYPGMPTAGTVTDTIVSQLDVFPTICDLIGAEKPNWLEGYSMRPLLEGRADSIRNAVFAEVNYHGTYQPMRCIRTDRYKLVKWYCDPLQTLGKNIDPSPSRDYLFNHGWLEDTSLEREMLFDLYLDPVERINLRHHPRYASIYRELSDELKLWMENTDDPLLYGDVAKPEGAIVND